MIRRFSAIRRELMGTSLRSRISGSVTCRRHLMALTTSDCSTEEDSIDHHSLLNSVHQGHYKYVLMIWEREKELGRADPALYTIVMAMCEHMKSAELAVAVREDMERENWEMNAQCCVHYVKALMSEGKVEEAFDFVKSSYMSNMKEGDHFLLECAKVFQDSGHVQEALRSCDLHLPTVSGGGRHSIPLDAIRIECLGTLQDSEGLLAFVTKHYGDTTECPPEIQAALVNGLALADKLNLALEKTWVSFKEHNVLPVKSLAMLLECAARRQDYRTAAALHHQHWDKTSQLTDENFKDINAVRSSYLLRAVNASIFLQAIHLRKKASNLHIRQGVPAGASREEEEQSLGQFEGRSFFRWILEHSLVPNSSTLEAMLLRTCFDENSRQTVENIVRAVVRNGEKPNPRAFTMWARHCGKVFATPRIRKVILQVRMLVHGYSIPLGHSECEDLVSIKYFNSTEEQKLAASHNVRIIERIMKNNDLLSDVHGWNTLLSGHLRAAHLKHTYSTLRSMTEAGLKPNLDTFKILTDGLYAMGDHHSYVLAAYDFWREFTKEYPRLKPDMEYLNKLIGCCRKCRHVERGLFFLGVAEQCDLTPNLATFRQLLAMLSDCNEKSKFRAILEVARERLPSPAERASLEAIVADCELKWKAEVDAELASSIILGSTKLPGTVEQSKLRTDKPTKDIIQ